MVGMRDVAKRAGVSVSSVSLVINGTGYVSRDMREKVEQAMRELDYVPNELARNFYHGKTDIIGVIVPTIQHPFFATLTAHLQHEFADRGLQTMLCSTADSANGEAQYVDMLRRHSLDALVVAAHTTHDPQYWRAIDRPVVAFDRNLGAGITQVSSDHVHGGELIAELLVRTGAHHVVMVGGPRAQFTDLGDHSTFPTVRYVQTLEDRLPKRGLRTRTSSRARCSTSPACGVRFARHSTHTRTWMRSWGPISPPHSPCRRRSRARSRCPVMCRSSPTTAHSPRIAPACRSPRSPRISGRSRTPSPRAWNTGSSLRRNARMPRTAMPT